MATLQPWSHDMIAFQQTACWTPQSFPGWEELLAHQTILAHHAYVQQCQAFYLASRPPSLGLSKEASEEPLYVPITPSSESEVPHVSPLPSPATFPPPPPHSPPPRFASHETESPVPQSEADHSSNGTVGHTSLHLPPGIEPPPGLEQFGENRPLNDSIEAPQSPPGLQSQARVLSEEVPSAVKAIASAEEGVSLSQTQVEAYDKAYDCMRAEWSITNVGKKFKDASGRPLVSSSFALGDEVSDAKLLVTFEGTAGKKKSAKAAFQEGRCKVQLKMTVAKEVKFFLTFVTVRDQSSSSAGEENTSPELERKEPELQRKGPFTCNFAEKAMYTTNDGDEFKFSIIDKARLLVGVEMVNSELVFDNALSSHR